MKVILTGSTGFIGKAVLLQCLHNPAITSIIALSRRNLPEEEMGNQNPKLIVVIMKDFKVYPDSVLEQLKGADACIWSMGTYNWDEVVELEYPEAFQKALAKVLDVNKIFRYVYLGGAFTETDQAKELWLLSVGRHMRGLAQTRMLTFSKAHQSIEPYVARPAGVLARGGIRSVGHLLRTIAVPIIWVDELGAAMTDLTVNGGSESVVWTKALVARGKEVLATQKQKD